MCDKFVQEKGKAFRYGINKAASAQDSFMH